ncbi:permease for cytosine/purines, uracil, thiamine, allantoin-domain-containing protein [Kockiozyma suomiensis]|uniref:permease for cytosine/purines, uracil, thiamine, allantoin-domain-containing protein n=1 Tax=Kockiozyma suomiensis TaxID=1337062 RepID=UPI00334430C3
MDHRSSGFWSRLDRRLRVNEYEPGRHSNHDLDPVPVEERTWTGLDYTTYWISDNFSPQGWRKVASLVTAGMSWRTALLNVAISDIVVAAVVTANGYAGAKYRVPFAVQARVSFGYYMSWLPILLRCVVGIFWYGIAAYTGGECVRSMLYAIWPSFRNLKNQLPKSANIDTQMMISYFIYWLSILPLHYVPISRIKWMFWVKSITLPIAGFGILGWTIKNAGAGNNSLWNEGNAVHGSAFSWLFMQGLYSNIGGWATLGLNSPDFTRYARRPRDSLWMLIALPASATLIAFFGVVSAAGSITLYGKVLWDPLLFIDKWTSAGGRAAAFFCALVFYFAQATNNISANSISAANDLNCLFPRYINIRRGQYIVSILGTWALTPWNVLTSALSFLSFMSGTAVWLAPLCGILISDFYLVHRRKYNVWEMYENKGIYRYNKFGTNWVAVAAFTIGWVPILPGLLPNVNSNIVVSKGVENLYYCGYFYGFFSAAGSYWLLSTVFPARQTILEQAVYCDGVVRDDIESRADDDESGEKNFGRDF